MDFNRTVVGGAISGLVGTTAMSVVMFGAQKAGLVGKMPPARITEAAMRVLGLRRSSPGKELLATAAHFGYGIAGGVLFALLARGPKAPSPLAGALFGTSVWAASYMGWIPLLGIMPPPRRDRPGRPTAMVIAHIVYGALTGQVAGKIAGKIARTTASS
jgi:uncharacterized membrane protein YagU involved in acid resistance